MAYFVRPAPSFEKKLLKLAKKDPLIYQRLMKKVNEIAQNPYLYKPMSNVLKGK